MNHDDRIDALAIGLASRQSRRRAVGTTAGLLGAAIAGALSREAGAQDSSTADDTRPVFLFVQTAASGTLSPNPAAGTPVVDATPVPGGGAEYVLTLEGHHGGTIYFSDRPERIFGDTPTQRFLEGFGFTPVNPPNAALVVQTDAGVTDVVVLELISPVFDASAGTVTYGATILTAYDDDSLAHAAEQQLDDELPESFGLASLFIDDCSEYSQCIYWDLAPNPLPGFEVAGPIPDGPYPACYSADQGCKPCSTTFNNLANLCDATYTACTANSGCTPV